VLLARFNKCIKFTKFPSTKPFYKCGTCLSCGFCFVSQGANVAVDEVLNTFVLDYDLVNKRLDLTVDSNLVRRRKEIKSKNKKKVMNRD
jgi:hypothetical protein